ncbi:MAG: YojF family protein [Bacillales bacterium]
MKPVDVRMVQEKLDGFAGKNVYIHLETTNGAYAAHRNEGFFSAGAFIRNARIRYKHGKIAGAGPYRIGLKMDAGWVYAEGITHFEVDGHGRLLLAGHDHQGRLAVCLELSETPFDE